MSSSIYTPEDIERCDVLQNEEWDVLESIYPDFVSIESTRDVVRLEIPVGFSEPRFVTTPELNRDNANLPSTSTLQENNDSDRAQKGRTSLSTFPPLLLAIHLPASYPLHSPPNIISIHATHSWIPVKGLREKLLDMWQEGEGVLYPWVDLVQSGLFLEGLGLTETVNGEHILRLSHPAPHILIPLLVTYDTSAQQSRFSQTSYTCEICMTSIKGAKCILLSCSHIFCRSCLEDFWRLCIAEGDVGRVGCPDPACVKEGREANEEEVRRVVSEEEVGRWKWLRQKRLFDKDPTIIHCPLSLCQAPVAAPQNVEEGSGWSRLRTCTECGFSFCSFCRRTWHGPHSDCPITGAESFILEYLALPEGSSERTRLERRYGKANIQRLIAKYEEERANKKWMDESTTSCPSCSVKVEKSMGCNHMECSKCGQHFCYRCGSKISAGSPYQHFSTPGISCYNKLFEV